MRTSTSFLALLAVPFTTGAPFNNKPCQGSTVNATQLFRFNDSTWIENLAVRPNGQLILTTVLNSNLFTFDPTIPEAVPKVALPLPSNFTATTGIAELSPDRFLVAAGQLTDSPAIAFSNNTFLVVDFTDLKAGPKITKTLAGHGPPNGWPNGVVALDRSVAPDVALVADSIGGTIWRVDAHDPAGTVEVVFTDPALAPGARNIGVNGLRIFDGYLYFTNTQTGVLSRVGVSADGRTFGRDGRSIEVVAQLEDPVTNSFDDFAIDEHTGDIYAVVHPGLVERIYQNGTQEVLVGAANSSSSDLLVFGTSVAFSRRGPMGSIRDPKKLFVTSGGFIAATNAFTGGQVVEVVL